jgi:hypothetical protein
LKTLGGKHNTKPGSKNNPKEPFTTLSNMLYTKSRVVEGGKNSENYPTLPILLYPQYKELGDR